MTTQKTGIGLGVADLDSQPNTRSSSYLTKGNLVLAIDKLVTRVLPVWIPGKDGDRCAPRRLAEYHGSIGAKIRRPRHGPREAKEIDPTCRAAAHPDDIRTGFGEIGRAHV